MKITNFNVWGDVKDFDARVRWLFDTKESYVLHGEIALHLCCSLEQARRQMEPFLQDGTYRLLTQEELISLGKDVSLIAYVKSR